NMALITNQADFVNPSNAGKRYVITQDFSLSSDVTLPAGVTITGEGSGIVDVLDHKILFVDTDFDIVENKTVLDFSQYTQGTTFTFTATGGETQVPTLQTIRYNPIVITINGVVQNFENDYIFRSLGSPGANGLDIISFSGGHGALNAGDVVAINYVSESDMATIDAASTFGTGDINMKWFGAVGDGNTMTNSGFDNRNVFRQSQKISIYSGADLLLEGDTGDNTFLYDLAPSERFVRDVPTNVYITGTTHLILGGETILGALTHNLISTEVVEVYDAKDAIVEGGMIMGDWMTHDYTTGLAGGAHGVAVAHKSDNVIVKSRVSQVSGDCVLGKYDVNFVYLNAIVEAVFTKNNIIDESGAIVSNTDFAYSDFFSITQTVFDENGVLFGGGSFGGFFGLDVHQYYMAFYNASDVFISRTDLIETYTPIAKPEGATQMRLIIYQPSVWANLRGSVYAPSFVNNLTVSSPSLSYGVRQGISNMPPNSTIDGTHFTLNGRRLDGTTGTPGFNFDNEDGYQNLRKIDIRNSIFENGKGGDIILKGSVDITIHDNKFVYNRRPQWVNVNVIGLSNGTNTRFYNNLVQSRTLEMGRGNKVYNNTFMDTQVTFSLEKERFENNTQCFNMRIRENPISPGNEHATLQNNVFIYDKPLSNQDFVFATMYHTRHINNLYDFQGNNADGLHRLSTSSSGFTVPPRGFVDGMEVRGITAVGTTALFNLGLQWSLMPINNLKSSISFDIRGGLPMDTKLTNLDITGWINLELNDFPSTNAGSDYPTIDLSGSKILINEPDHVAFFGRAFVVEDVDVNIFWEGGSITMDIGDSSRRNKVLGLTNHGTKIFKNVTFRNNGAVSTQTLDATYEFIDCTFENITFPGATIITTGGGGATDLSYTASPTTGTVTSSTGTNAIIPLTDVTNSGLFSSAEKTKLGTIDMGAQINVAPTKSVIDALNINASELGGFDENDFIRNSVAQIFTGSVMTFNNLLQVGSNGNGDSELDFYDDLNNLTRRIYWDSSG
ncbi:MAG: hypothetical protein HAW67_05355, partial [Endozoicomonadaceae bacterium]|nr:hypothetical protein [Endozoicomonadaceae bacterium]